ncbi:MAG: hypothetical protein ABI206_14515, partial [Antricoccus sp.]
MRTAVVSVVAVLLALAGCTTDTSKGGSAARSGAGATSSSKESKPAEDPALATAKQQAAQYDYDTAIATLTGDQSAEAQQELATVTAGKAAAVPWADNTTIPHIFYHSLIVDPARAFGSNEATGFDKYMVTVSEFTKQLQQMYDNGWVLIHPERIATVGADGAMSATPIVLPPSKKPLVLSIDDVSYYEYMTGKGFATNLVTTADGKVLSTYTDAVG